MTGQDCANGNGSMFAGRILATQIVCSFVSACVLPQCVSVNDRRAGGKGEVGVRFDAV